MASERIPALRHFNRRVVRGPNCWGWRGYADKDGYGTVKHAGRPLRAHRFSWEIHNGPIPEGLCVCHKCDNPGCVRPDHLFLGTSADNMHDRDAKGRCAFTGTRNPHAVLTAAIANAIRAKYTGAYGQQASLAREYGVDYRTVSAIIGNKIWKQIPAPAPASSQS